MPIATEKFITTHHDRVRRANEYRAKSPEPISIFDREAIVEFYLLEDVVRLYQFRLAREEAKVVNTRAGRMAKERNIAKYKAIIDIFMSTVEIAWGEIDAGNYKIVWSNIPEHALMVAANSIKYLPQLRDIAVKMIKGISAEMLEAQTLEKGFEEDLDDVEAHEANYRRYYNMPDGTKIEAPSAEKIQELIDKLNEVIPDNDNTVKYKSKLS